MKKPEMNAFDMISEPILVTWELREYTGRVRRCVELIQSLADALLADDRATIQTVHEQMSGTWHDLNETRLALYGQVKGMRFHVASGDAFSRYMTCQDRVADSLQGLADLLVLRGTPFPVELRDDFRALVAEVVNISRRTMSLAEELFSDAETVRTDADATPENTDCRDRVRQRQMEFGQRLYGLEKQLDPVTVMVLDKCRAVLREVADNAEGAAEHLRLMVG